MNHTIATPRVSAEVLSWVAEEIISNRLAIREAERHEQKTGYDIDATIERRELEAVNDALEHVQKYLAGWVN